MFFTKTDISIVKLLCHYKKLPLWNKKPVATNSAAAAAATTEKCQVFGGGIRGIFEGP